jgi:hypothetical protein
MNEKKVKWTSANQNIRMLRYDYPLAVGKRHIRSDVYDSSKVQEHLSYVTGNSSQASHNTLMASKARRQRNLRCSSNIFSAPAYPNNSKVDVRFIISFFVFQIISPFVLAYTQITEKITGISPVKLSQTVREMRKQPAAGIKIIGDDY